VILWERTDAQQGGDYRYLGLLRQFLQFLVRPRDYSTPSGYEHRTLGLVHHTGRLLDLGRMPPEHGLVAGEIYLGGILELSLFNKDITRDINKNRTRSPCSGNMEGLFNRDGHIRSTHNHVVVFGDRQRNAGYVYLLESVFANKRSGYLSSQCYDRGGIEVCIGNPGYQIGSARSRSRTTHSRFAGNPGIAIGGMSRRLFMANQYMP
jgi:hypothetical protein